MLGELDNTHLDPGLTYVLAECPHCRTRYASVLDPFLPNQWVFYQRDHVPQALSHSCTGGLLCLRGHELVITHKQAVLTQAGNWLNVMVPDAQPVLN